MNYDITFCSNTECENKECRRYYRNALKLDKPVSFSDFKDCKYWEEKND